MVRISRSVLIVVVAVGLAASAFGVGRPQDWPFSALPPEAIAYLEVPNPLDLCAGVDRFAAGVLGMPFTNLVQSKVASLVGSQQLAGLDWSRPAGMVLLKSAAGAEPSAVVLIPVKGEKDLLADFKDPVTGESPVEKTEDGYALPNPGSPGDKMYLAFAGTYVAVGQTPQSAKQMAGQLTAHPDLFTRKCPVEGHVLIHVPVSRVWSTYQQDIEMGLDNMRSLMTMTAQMQPAANAAMAQTIVNAEIEGLVGIVKQIDGLVLAAKLDPAHVRLTKRMTAKAGTGLAAFVAANPGVEDLPYKSAIPPNSFMACTYHVNMTSMQPLVDFIEQKVLSAVFPATSEVMQRCRDMVAGSMKQCNGDIMAAYNFDPEKTGGVMGMQVYEIVGMGDPASGMRFLDDTLAQWADTTFKLSGEATMNVKVKKTGSAERATNYHIVMSASGDPQMENMTKTMYGEGMDVFLAPCKTGVVYSTDKGMISQIVSRADGGGTAAFHPMENLGTPKRIAMVRCSILDLMRMAQKMVEAEGQKFPLNLPTATTSAGILLMVGVDQGDVQDDLIVPLADITTIVQAAMGALTQQTTPPPPPPQPESY